MKRLVSLCFLALLAIGAFAQQKDVTTFLGIPVDGTKAAMRQKLIAKGFTPTKLPGFDFLEGEFNGRDVQLYIVTNNNKVYRIGVADANGCDEAQIKIRFNNLVHQFENNKRYYTLSDQTLSDEEDISHEMLVNNKVYDAFFFQKQKNEQGEITEIPAFKKTVWFRICKSAYNEYYIAMYYDNEYNKANGEDL